MSKSADELTVRPAVSSDRDQFLALWTGWQDHMGGRVPDEVTARSWNAAVMELGALVCISTSPRCPDCPVLDLCAWQQAGRPAYRGRVGRTQAWRGTDRLSHPALI